MKILIFTLCAIVGSAASAHAEKRERAGTIETIIITNFTGRIEIIPSSDSYTYFNHSCDRKSGKTSLVTEAAALEITGPKRARKFNATDAVNERLYGDEAFDRYLDQFCILQIETPAGRNLSLVNTIANIVSAHPVGALTIDGGWIEGVFSDVLSADISMEDRGALAFGTVDGPLSVLAGGSMSVTALQCKDAELRVGGSSFVRVDAVDGDTLVRVNGSGDVRLGDISGGVTASIAGSGDVITGIIAGPADFSIAGSGDIDAAQILSPVTAHLAGNGDVLIREGKSEQLTISILGTGDFSFGGTATNINAVMSGTGSLAVARHDGILDISGHGDVSIGDDFQPE